MPDTLIVNARLVNEGREFDGDLRISGGRIAEIGGGLSARDGEAVVREILGAQFIEEETIAPRVTPQRSE